MITILILGLAFLPIPVVAYIDPGTGSYIFQIVVASALGGLIAVKASWRRIAGFFQRAKKEDKNLRENNDTQQSSGE